MSSSRHGYASRAGRVVRTGDVPVSVAFAFEDERWLAPGQHEGGLAHVFDEAPDPAPLLVWLHGTNEGGPLHRGLGAPGFDLRTFVPRTMIVAAPSQTRDAASGSRLWIGFDLTAFVSAVEGATGRAVDRARVIVAGHSGAACSAAGGLLAPLGAVVPSAVIAIDGCLDARFGALFGALGERTAVHVFHQTRTWPRDPRAFAQAFAGRGSFVELTVVGDSPHEDIVPLALERVLSGDRAGA